MANICVSCHSGCCRAYRLPITIFDFVEITEQLGLQDALKGITFEVERFNPNYTMNPRSAFPFVFDDEQKKGKHYTLALKRIKSELFPDTVKCYFLEEAERTAPINNPDSSGLNDHPGSKYSGYCSIYDTRPSMCRTYPIVFNEDSYRSVLKRRTDPSKSKEKNVYKICPKNELEISDFGTQDISWMMQKQNEIFLSHMRTNAHNQLALRWNSQPERKYDKVISFMISAVKDLIIEHKPAEYEKEKKKSGSPGGINLKLNEEDVLLLPVQTKQ